MKTFNEYLKVANTNNGFTCYVNYDLLGFLLMTLGRVGQYKHIPYLSNSGLDMDEIMKLMSMEDKETIQKIHDIARQSENQGDGHGVTRTGNVYLDLDEIQSLKELMNKTIYIANRIMERQEIRKDDEIAWKNVINASKQQLIDVSVKK